MRHLIFIGFLILWATPGWSHQEVDARNRVTLQVEANREIPNDWATARLSVVAEGKDPADVAESVNRQMALALKTARATPGVEVASGAYVTQPVYDDGRVVRWRASQILRIESGDVDLEVDPDPARGAAGVEGHARASRVAPAAATDRAAPSPAPLQRTRDP